MLQDIENWDGKNVEDLKEIYDRYHSSSDWFEIVLECLKTDSMKSAKAGSWLFKYDLEHGALKKYLKVKSKLDNGANAQTEEQIRELVSALVDGVSHSDDWEIRLHLLQILKYVQIHPEVEKPLKSIVDASFSSDIKFVRAWAYDALYRLMLQYPEYQSEFEARISSALNNESGAVMARIRNILKEDQK